MEKVAWFSSERLRFNGCYEYIWLLSDIAKMLDSDIEVFCLMKLWLTLRENWRVFVEGEPVWIVIWNKCEVWTMWTTKMKPWATVGLQWPFDHHSFFKGLLKRGSKTDEINALKNWFHIFITQLGVTCRQYGLANIWSVSSLCHQMWVKVAWQLPWTFNHNTIFQLSKSIHTRWKAFTLNKDLKNFWKKIQCNSIKISHFDTCFLSFSL